MIPSAVINTRAAKEGLRSQLIELDYVLGWILVAISELPQIRKDWIFKGGTALRKLYFPTWRYSEDLDFTIVKKYDSSGIKKCLEQISGKVQELSGISLGIKNPEELNRINENESIKIALTYVGPLLKTAHPRSLSLDLTFDELVLMPPKSMQIITDYPDQTNIKKKIMAYSLDEILSEKIRSIIQRREPRDLYDVWRIFQEHSNKINFPSLSQNLLKKCAHRKLENISLVDIFKERATKVLERQWEIRLAYQINDLPPFSKVLRETKRLLKKHL